MQGYQPGDPVRVLLPLALDDERVTCEGKVIEVLPGGYFRVKVLQRRDLRGCIIEQVAVKVEHFT